MRQWFDEYTGQFIRSGDRGIAGNAVFKTNHSKRVLALSEIIGRSLKLGSSDMEIVRAAALLHDVGRFEQYARYRTFVDHKSVDHAAAGVRLLIEKNILGKFAENKRELIIKAIKYHNLKALPGGQTRKTLLISKLLRDADKIDILKIVTDYYKNKNLPKGEKLVISFPDKPRINASIVEKLLNDKMVNYREVRTLNDFKLLQVSWFTDLNFPKSVQLVRKRRYLEKLISVLPKDPEILTVYKHIKNRIKA